jgi:hypothetical protein
MPFVPQSPLGHSFVTSAPSSALHSSASSSSPSPPAPLPSTPSGAAAAPRVHVTSSPIAIPARARFPARPEPHAAIATAFTAPAYAMWSSARIADGGEDGEDEDGVVVGAPPDVVRTRLRSVMKDVSWRLTADSRTIGDGMASSLMH